MRVAKPTREDCVDRLLERAKAFLLVSEFLGIEWREEGSPISVNEFDIISMLGGKWPHNLDLHVNSKRLQLTVIVK